MWSPALSSVAMARCIAAMPLAVQIAPTPPSSAASRSSSTAGGRIGDARIDVAGALEVEQRGGVVGILEHVGRGLVDRHRAGAGRGIGMLARMQAQGFESAGGFGAGMLGLVNSSVRQFPSKTWKICHRSGTCVSR